MEDLFPYRCESLLHQQKRVAVSLAQHTMFISDDLMLLYSRDRTVMCEVLFRKYFELHNIDVSFGEVLWVWMQPVVSCFLFPA